MMTTETPILKRLDDERVFHIELQSYGKFRVMESCDLYFYVDLSADEMKELAAEILHTASTIHTPGKD